MDDLRLAAVAAAIKQRAPIILDIVSARSKKFAVPTTDSIFLTEARSRR